jgi:hypothetical protein
MESGLVATGYGRNSGSAAIAEKEPVDPIREEQSSSSETGDRSSIPYNAGGAVV